jgi:hypothetical protein
MKSLTALYTDPMTIGRVLFPFLATTLCLAQSSAELKLLFDEDQNDRRNWQSMTQEQKTRMAERDSVRLKRTRELVNNSRLKTGEDFERAAILFQHGASSADYLLAHILAMTAMSVDPPRGRWIAAATLDRYLESTGSKQVFGTQLHSQPFNEELLPDSIRTANCVPSLKGRLRMVEALKTAKPMPSLDPCAGEGLKGFVGQWMIAIRVDGRDRKAELTIGESSATIATGEEKINIRSLTLVGSHLQFQIDTNDGVYMIRVKHEGDGMIGAITTPEGKQGTVVGLR